MLDAMPNADGVPELSLAVIASGSSGNASVLRVRDQCGAVHFFAIDAGLSPRRTFAAHRELGVSSLAGVLLTHLDSDHWHSGWPGVLPLGTCVHVHQGHLGRAGRMGATYARTNVLAGNTMKGKGSGKRDAEEGSFELVPGVVVRWMLSDHDESGSVTYRFDHACGASVGYATDLGRVHRQHEALLAGVSVLAIESNYCPHLQRESDRPQFLKDRVTGGYGHLSNEQSAALVRAVNPQGCVVLLHLSEQCNTPERALSHHAHAVPVLVTGRHVGTGWVAASASSRPERPRPHVIVRSVQQELWEVGSRAEEQVVKSE
jgi:ribonuclease BN (tRNA processing enzyme)